ncbi:MAG: hypothetical protein JNL70_12530 [Saprospiraceae bacterium]|nr:hypothetical protein [Saprospiraceae bacterium]
MRRLITFTFFLAITFHIQAQYLEVGINGGAMSYIGDLQPNTPDTRSFGLSGGAYARYNFSPLFAAKFSGTYGQFVGADKYAYGSRKSRNLESVTTIYEAALTGEMNLTKFDIVDGRITAPYIFAGVAGFYFNPQVKVQGVLTDLQPLGTEGQLLNGGKGYSRFALSIPAGAGFKIAINRRVNVGFEFGFRYAFTDYLDDVSGNYPNIEELAKQSTVAAAMSYRMPEYFNQRLENPQGTPRGDKYKNDLYYQAGFTLSVNLATKEKMEFNKEYRAFMKTQ